MSHTWEVTESHPALCKCIRTPDLQELRDNKSGFKPTKLDEKLLCFGVIHYAAIGNQSTDRIKEGN